MTTTIETPAVVCPDCTQAFKSRAGAGAHRSRIHGKKLDGTKGARKRAKEKGRKVAFQVATGTIEVTLSDNEVKAILANHSTEVLDSVV